MANGTGSTTIDFGIGNGTNVVSTVVTGLSGFVNTDSVEIWIMGSDFTASHTAYEHSIVPIILRAVSPITGTGFTIRATSLNRLTGVFTVRYVWAS